MIALKQGNENAQNNMIASFSFASTGKCNSMFKSVGSLLRIMKKDLIDLELTIKFSECESTGKCNSMVELFTSTVRAKIWTIQRSHLAPQRAKNTVNEQPNT